MEGRKEFFISHSSVDREWAAWIAWNLEDAGFSTVLQDWDFSAGSNFVLEMQNAVAATNRTIVVLSPAFLTSKFTPSEWAAAFGADPEGVKRKLIPVRVAECSPTGLLAQIVYIDLTSLDEVDARQALLKRISPERPKPLLAPRFPSSPVDFQVAGGGSGSRPSAGIGRRFIHAQITAAGLLDLSPGVHPYRPVTDPTDDSVAISDSPVSAFVWFPHTDRFRTAPLSPYTPVASFCTSDPADAITALRASLKAPTFERLKKPPTALMNEDKERVLRAVAEVARRSFIASVAIPAAVLGPAKANPVIAYQTMTNLFLVPLIGMHHSLEVRRFDVTLAPVGDCNRALKVAAKRVLSATYPAKRGQSRVEFASDETSALCGVARFISWATGLYYNEQNRRWVDLIESVMSQ